MPKQSKTEKKSIFETIVKLVSDVEKNQFKGTLEDVVKEWKKSLSDSKYTYDEYVAASKELSGYKVEGTLQYWYEKEVVSVITQKQTGVRLSKVIGDRLKDFVKEFNSKDGKERKYKIIENNPKTKKKMIDLTNNTLDKIEQDLIKLYTKLSNREDI